MSLLKKGVVMNKIAVLVWGLCVTGTTSLILLYSTILSTKSLNPLPWSDKIYRAVTYAVLAFMIAGLFRSLTNHHLSSIIMEAVTITTLLALFLEFLQFLIPQRTADIIDACADIVGACVGGTLFYVVYYLLYL